MSSVSFSFSQADGQQDSLEEDLIPPEESSKQNGCRCSPRRKWAVSAVVAVTVAIGIWAMVGCGGQQDWSFLEVPQIEDGEDVDVGMDIKHISWLISIFTLASFPGCLLGGYLADHFGAGPRMLLFGAVLPCVIGWALVTQAHNFWMLIFACICIGISAGSIVVSVAVFSAYLEDDR